MKFTYSECFAGMGAWGKAIERVTNRHGDECELKYYFEFDKYASNAFSAIHGVDESLNKWDLTKECSVPKVDVFFYSPPCQTFSIAGKREGTTVDKGNLFYHAMQKLEQSKPMYAIMENVKGLPSGDTKADFNAMLWYLESIGYYNYWQVLNSKDYGIPQNRERVFIVSIRSDVYDQGKRFEFPNPVQLEKTLKDYADYDDNFKVPRRILENFNNKKGGFENRLKTTSGDRPSMCLTTKNKWSSNANNFYTRDLKEYRNDEIVKQNIDVWCNSTKMNFLLQGFDEQDYLNAAKVNSAHQLCIRTGNSITVNVIEEILENLLYDREQNFQQLSMF